MGFKHALAAGLMLAARVLAQPADPLLKPDPRNWLTYSGQYHAQRHTALKQITAANVGRLQAKWVYHMTGQKDLEATPIVANGVMYISQYNRIDAIDARTGNIIWQYQRQPIASGAQRGTGFWNNKLYVTTNDKHLVALDARNGSVLWDVPVHDGLQPAGQAPLIAHGKLIISGNQPHGFMQGYDADTGKYLWSWTPVPGADDPKALASWGGQKPDGIPIWVSGSYDPELNLIYYGTGQPEPQWAGEGRPGDNLYSDSIVALDPDTGKLKWYYQNTPHDTHDYDSLEMPVLVDAMWKGKPRKLLLQANRNGFYYVLDRTDGEFLQASPFVSRIDWLKGWDDKGHPIPDPAHDPSVKGTTTCPSTAGPPTGRRRPTIRSFTCSMSWPRKAAASMFATPPATMPAPAIWRVPTRAEAGSFSPAPLMPSPARRSGIMSRSPRIITARACCPARAGCCSAPKSSAS